MKRCPLVLMALISGFLSMAQDNSALLWEVSGNGLQKKSYVFGTIHMIPKKDYFFTDLMKEKFRSCEMLVTEIDMNIPILKQLEIAKMMYLPNGSTLADYMTAEEYVRFRSYLVDSVGIRKSRFEKYVRLKPFFIGSLVSKELSGKIKAYEKELYKMAKNAGMFTAGLETIEYQMSLVDEVDLADQVKSMQEETGKFRESQRMLQEMTRAYCDQDLDKLYALLKVEEQGNIEFSEKFINKRNRNWIKEMAKKMQTYSCFFAVGAAHLPGEQGVLNLLRIAGYEVKAVK